MTMTERMDVNQDLKLSMAYRHDDPQGSDLEKKAVRELMHLNSASSEWSRVSQEVGVCPAGKVGS